MAVAVVVVRLRNRKISAGCPTSFICFCIVFSRGSVHDHRLRLLPTARHCGVRLIVFNCSANINTMPTSLDSAVAFPGSAYTTVPAVHLSLIGGIRE